MKTKSNISSTGFISKKPAKLEENRKTWEQRNATVRADEANKRIALKKQKKEEENNYLE
ncbi:hypothetical protein [Acaryochloris thomasi]|uniref:hypothetical protein n=1 Tax=Acaryochloris thomasi TaxID=2929456 RepID=UPI0013146523|nr:hypothetical protein [Acaryochloris thomasi]